MMPRDGWLADAVAIHSWARAARRANADEGGASAGDPLSGVLGTIVRHVSSACHRPVVSAIALGRRISSECICVPVRAVRRCVHSSLETLWTRDNSKFV